MHMKRVFDFSFSLVALLIMFFPIIILMMFVWFNDYSYPLYISNRVGKNGKLFRMYKLRSMILGAHKSGVNSTSNDDHRITTIGHIIRKYKFDEIMQLWNVLLGDMSLVGPRPNIEDETKMYTNKENLLLSVSPGITDFSSIVFSDEGGILQGKKDPNLAYNQLIRPWKSRLGIVYIENQNSILDMQLIFFTIISLFSKKHALTWISRKLKTYNSNPKLIEISQRIINLYPYPPPGAENIIS
jgi:lipopolysaccharide/colanic/teichoic acid biosynthesis glycosyltransferase